MKKIQLTFLLFCFSAFAFASDLSFAVINETSGFSDGSIDMTVTGGVAPFTYSWSGPSGYTANTEDITGLVTGTYTVTVTDKYCGVATYTVLVDVSSDVTENSAILLTIYPNPSKGEITLNAGKTLNSADLKVMNVQGKTILEKKNISGSEFTFDLSEQPAGIYFVEINNGGVFSRVRFLKN